MRAGPPIELPERIDEATFRKARRALLLLPDDDPSRAEPVKRLVAYQAGRCRAALDEGDRDAAALAFDEALDLHAARRIARGAPDATLAPCAEGIARAFSPPGDESRVAAALIVLTRISPSSDARGRLDALLSWSREARAALTNPIERYGGLAEVLEGIVARIPDPTLVRELSDLYLERQRALSTLLENGPDGASGLSFEDFRRASIDLARTSYDIGRLYLRIDDPGGALAVLRRIEGSPGVDEEIVAAFQHLDEEPLRGLLELATIYGRGDPDTAKRVCRRGRLSYPEDARFAECLGQLSALVGDVESAAAHYDDAMRLEPGSFELFDQALAFQVDAMDAALDEDDPDRARASFDRAVELLGHVRSEWRDRRISVEPHLVYYRMGMGEFNAGRIDDAVRHLAASVEERANRPALLQLGIVAERRAQWSEARRLFRKALDMRPDEPRTDAYWRALLLERLGDAHAGEGEMDRASQLWREALASWDTALRPPRGTPPLGPSERATAALRKAILFDRLGETDVARDAFLAAVEGARGNREIFARLLSYLVARGHAHEALDVYRRALRQSSLPEEWKIYYALWVVGAQRRGGEAADQDAVAFLRGVAGNSWQERLARFWSGSVSYDDLLSHAHGAGERAEAHFYQALHLLADGQREPAMALLREVLESNMMGFFEYDMAREMLAGLR